MNERATLRFAVGVFDALADVDGTVRELMGAGMSQGAFSLLVCVALWRRHYLARTTPCPCWI